MRALWSQNFEVVDRRHFDSMAAWFGLKKWELAFELDLFASQVRKPLSSKASIELSTWAARKSIQFNPDGFTDRRRKVRIRWKS